MSSRDLSAISAGAVHVGTTHFCQPEDFPVMACEYVGFTLKPAGFFDRNPAIDLAPSRKTCR